MPFISRDTIAQMARSIFSNPEGPINVTSMICVAAYAGYFLQEVVLLGNVEVTGLEDQVRQQGKSYLATARAWASRILDHFTTDLTSLQALTYCVSSQ